MPEMWRILQQQTKQVSGMRKKTGLRLVLESRGQK
jgi:hypothetical protein